MVRALQALPDRKRHPARMGTERHQRRLVTNRYTDLVQYLLPDGEVQRIRFAWMDFVSDQD
jgi:hypothetical protein